MDHDTVFPRLRWFVLFVGCFAMCTTHIHMTSVPVILVTIAEDMNLNMGTASQFMTGWQLAMAVSGIVLGFVCDRFGLTIAIMSGMLVSLASALLTPVAGTSFWPFFFLRLLQGLSVGFVFPVIGFIGARWFPEKEHGLATGIYFGFVSLGSAVGVFVTPLILEAIGDWKMSIASLGVFNATAILLALTVARKKPPVIHVQSAAPSRDKPGRTGFRECLASPITWFGPLIVFANGWVFFGLYNFIPSFLASPAPLGVGLGPVASGYLSLSLMVIGVVSGLIGGFAYGRVFKGRARPHVGIAFVLGALSILLVFPLVQANVPLIALILMVAGFAIPFQNPAISSYIVKVYPANGVARMMGWWYGIGAFGSVAGLFCGSVLIGVTGGYGWAIGMIAVSALVGLVLTMLFMKDNLRVGKTGTPDDISKRFKEGKVPG